MKSKLADKITLRQLTIPVLIGVLPEERQAKQDITLDIELVTDLMQASTSDDLQHTIDYAAVRQRLIEAASNTQFQLIEALAGHLSELLLTEFPISEVHIQVSKKPFDMPDTHNVSVSLSRSKPS